MEIGRRFRSEVRHWAAAPVAFGLRLAGAGWDRARAVLPGPSPLPTDPPRLSGALPLVGHMAEFARNPFELLMRARAEGGEVVEIQLLNQPVVMLTGPEANEAFFRAPDDQLCRREAYKVMTPIFGKGVVFDAPVPRMNRQLQMIMPLLRDQAMRGYPAIVAEETRKMTARWGDRGEIDALAFMKELTIYTSMRCLLGDEFRAGLTQDFFHAYEHLEQGVDALAYLAPDLPLPKFRRRDAARAKVQAHLEAMMAKRAAMKDPPRDGLQILIESTYEDGSRVSAHELTGILIALVLAGHHTSAGTETWILIELLRRPDLMERVIREIDEVTSGGPELTYAMLRDMTTLGAVIKEVLRLHPPLIFLFRKVLREFRFRDRVVAPGKMVCAAPAVTHRLDAVFPEADRFNPERYADAAQEDPAAWIAFGGGKHKCTGNAFGVLQLKAIAATLLEAYELELVDDVGSYRDDYTKPTVQPRGPCRLRYRRRAGVKATARRAQPEDSKIPTCQLEVTIDRHRCQGHAVCVSEAPEVFRVGADSVAEVALDPALISLQSTPLTARFYPAIEHNQQVVSAARFCPNKAILVEETRD
jgi:sterol 14-demethylase